MANINSSAGSAASAVSGIQMPGQYADAKLLEMLTRWKRESFDQRWVYERQWMRNINYMLFKQWQVWDSQRSQWRDKRMAKWIPRPVTNIPKESVQSVRAGFAQINYGANARPIGTDRMSVVTAGVVDEYGPILHADHKMDQVLNEFDWWLLVTGNAFLHTCVDFDRKNGVVKVTYSTCLTCAAEYGDDVIGGQAQQVCPECGGNQFQPSMGPDGQPKVEERPLPGGLTMSLSPFEVAFPLVYERFDLSPYVIRMRWRDRSYYEQHPEFAAQSRTMNFAKMPQERTMQLFKSLPFQNDLGLAPSYFGAGGGAGSESDGLVEYDVWVKPCNDFPEGQVIRFAGDSAPFVVHSELESLPGPLPYHDAKGNPLFTFSHGVYDSVGGRAMGSGLLDPIIQKVDQLNQVDSLMLMIIMRAANPIWLEPKGAEVEKFTGEPGLVVKWNPLVMNGQAKPERIPGENIPSTLFMYRDGLKAEIEELSGVYKIQKGGQPAGVDTFATANLLLEQGQARHTSAFKSRGQCYKDWFKFALEIEREFGEETRTRAVMKETKEWAFETFKKADLSGNVEIIIEDGTLTPKTALGERAAIDHLNVLQLLKPDDPEQVYEIYRKFGLTSLLPSMDGQVQQAWMNMEKFEQLMLQGGLQQLAMEQVAEDSGQGAVTSSNPLTYKRWYNPQIHRQELLRWAVSDRARDLFEKVPECEVFVEQYLVTIDMALMEMAMGGLDSNGKPQPVKPGKGGNGAGAGAQQAMSNSNQNSAGVGPSSSGPGGTSSGAENAV